MSTTEWLIVLVGITVLCLLGSIPIRDWLYCRKYEREYAARMAALPEESEYDRRHPGGPPQGPPNVVVLEASGKSYPQYTSQRQRRAYGFK